MADFFQTYFVDYACRGYNIYNTLVYGILFAIAVFGAYKILKKLNLQIDRKFLIGIFPFIVLGPILRVIEDAGEASGSMMPLICSPLIYFVMFFVALGALLLAIGVEKVFGKKKRSIRIVLSKKNIKAVGSSSLSTGAGGRGNGWWEYYKTWFTVGLILDIIFITFLLQNGIKNYFSISLVLGIAAAWWLIIFFFYKLREKIHANFLSRFNAFLLSVHMFDATTTFVALQYFPYYEQHVLSNFTIGIVGPAGQFLIKLPILLVVLYLLERELPKKEDENMKNFIKVAILILGLGPGLRNFLRLGLGI
ncbi:MAG: DUF63 family protein [Candidatus Aenigmarchaeota archaeon]|nr:DUF63 family protein [Candidatus Aenigmarchaeota archaeon]